MKKPRLPRGSSFFMGELFALGNFVLGDIYSLKFVKPVLRLFGSEVDKSVLP